MGSGLSQEQRELAVDQRQLCALAFKLGKKVVFDGTGEGQPAHGFVIIMALAKLLFEMKENGKPKLGKIMNPDLYDYRDKNFNLKDANAYATLCLLAREDGAIVVDLLTGKILGGNYSIFDLSEAQHDMSGGTRHRSASSLAQITGGFVIVASEAECKKLTSAEYEEQLTARQSATDTSTRDSAGAPAAAKKDGGKAASTLTLFDKAAKDTKKATKPLAKAVARASSPARASSAAPAKSAKPAAAKEAKERASSPGRKWFQARKAKK